MCHIHGKRDGSLVILNGGENTGFVGGDGRVAGNDNTKDIALHSNTQRERSDIEQDKVFGLLRGLTSEDSSLNSSTVGDGFVRVDGFVQLATAEMFRDEGLYFGNTGGSTDQDDIVNFFARNFRILQDFLNRVNRRFKENGVDFLETSASDVSGKVFTLGVVGQSTSNT